METQGYNIYPNLKFDLLRWGYEGGGALMATLHYHVFPLTNLELEQETNFALFSMFFS
jgi:hypothetical protein